MISNIRDEQNLEIVSKTEDFGFLAKFLSKLSFLQKSRQSSSDTVKKSCDKIHKGYQILEFLHETLTIP